MCARDCVFYSTLVDKVRQLILYANDPKCTHTTHHDCMCLSMCCWWACAYNAHWMLTEIIHLLRLDRYKTILVASNNMRILLSSFRSSFDYSDAHIIATEVLIINSNVHTYRMSEYMNSSRLGLMCNAHLRCKYHFEEQTKRPNHKKSTYNLMCWFPIAAKCVRLEIAGRRGRRREKEQWQITEECDVPATVLRGSKRVRTHIFTICHMPMPTKSLSCFSHHLAAVTAAAIFSIRHALDRLLEKWNTQK